MTVTTDRPAITSQAVSTIPTPRRVGRPGPSAETTPRRLVIDVYARLSRNPDGDLEKIDRQVADCRRVIEANPQWSVGQVHVDNSLSAWKVTVRRPGWDALFSRLESGTADGVIVWHTDRLLRQPLDLELLMRVGLNGGMVVASCYGEHDPSNEDDRAMLRVQAMMAEKSSAATSRRIKRKKQGMREAGNMAAAGGARSFGFPGNDTAQWDKDPETGRRRAPRTADGERDPRPVSEEQVARERAAIQQGSQAIADGLPLAGVVRAWSDAGLTTTTGESWTSSRVRAVLVRGRNAGLVEHEGVEVAQCDDAVIDLALFRKVRARFDARRRGRPATGRYLASGLVKCGACGHSVSGRPAGTYRDGSPRKQYTCDPGGGGCGKVAADARGLDEWLRVFTVERLSDPEHSGRIASRVRQTNNRRAAVAASLEEEDRLSRALGDRLGRREITLDTFDAAMTPLRERVAALEVERDALDAEDACPPDPTRDAAAVAEEWAAADGEERRAMLQHALRLHRVTVAPATRRGAFDPARVTAVRV